MTHSQNTVSETYSPAQIAQFLGSTDPERRNITTTDVVVGLMLVGLQHLDAVRAVCLAFLDVEHLVADVGYRTLARGTAHATLLHLDDTHTPGEHRAVYFALVGLLEQSERHDELLPPIIPMLTSCLFDPGHEECKAADRCTGADLGIELVRALADTDEEEDEVIAALRKHVAALTAVQS